ncbi:DUF1801 domain-containing protein [Agromyces marinus]|uniref:YdhG-like domain-containing protein n=1 Tax=Agromyces marinus TaxID=1389020 RepID=A0ABM8H356_9MICO|nr:DUF1801 domain-containing protein [Agromyces marinus]UIP59759.1 hypothetical protein DSM26151_26730 [Agromyces marinus]BDZ55160.1 hypothetical protein GCM10025870_22330 [Agromyces marinus]
MERSDHDVDAFLDSLDGPRADAMRELDRVISAEFAGLERVLWEGVFWGGTDQRIVGYGAITQPRPKGDPVEWFLVGLAEQAAHVSVYVNAAVDGAYLVQRRADRLGRVRVGSAAIAITALDRLDMAGFVDLLREARGLAPDVR